MINPRSIKTQLILYLIALALFVAWQDRDPAFLMACSVCLTAAVLVEAVALYVRNRKFQVTESAVIAGMITGYVLGSDTAGWKLAAAAALVILFKYLIRPRNRHIFNPAAFGLFVSVLVLGVSLEWRATYLWYFLAPFGLYLAYKMKKMEILAGYGAVSLLLFGVQAFLQGVSPIYIFGYFSYFYIFIMVIEPKTTPANLAGKLIFGGGLAGMIFALTQSRFGFDVELFCLLAMNAAVPLFNKVPIKQGGAV